MTDGYHLAQVNIARPAEPLTSARLADFIAQLEPVNAHADSAAGFIWRLQTEDGDATSVRAFGDDSLIVNMSVWDSLESLAAFVYTGLHATVMRRRRDWFEQLAEAYQVLWWIPAGTIPTVPDAEARLGRLREQGPTADAFTTQRAFGPPVHTEPDAAVPGWESCTS